MILLVVDTQKGCFNESFTSFKNGEIPLTFILVAAIYLGQQIWQGVTEQDNISQLTHIVGGIVGSALAFAMQRSGRKNY